MYQRQGARQAARHTLRRPDGRFIALPAPDGSIHNDTTVNTTPGHTIETIDYGPYPVGASAPDSRLGTWQNTSLDLPPVEDTESIQLALIDVIQALAANQINAKPFFTKDVGL